MPHTRQLHCARSRRRCGASRSKWARGGEPAVSDGSDGEQRKGTARHTWSPMHSCPAWDLLTARCRWLRGDSGLPEPGAAPLGEEHQQSQRTRRRPQGRQQ
eukprot:1071557-Rhodomonas_salina.1